MVKDDFIKWLNVKEMREGYFVDYTPANSDLKFAILSLTILDNSHDIDLVRQRMENEFKYWAIKYAAPLMVSAFDDCDNCILMGNADNPKHITGFINPKTSATDMYWGLEGCESAPSFMKEVSHFKEIYSELPCKTAIDVFQSVEEHTKQIKKAKRTILIFAFLQLIWKLFATVIIGLPLKIYRGYKNCLEFLKLAGIVKRTEKEAAKSEEKALDRHLLYHAKKNPDAFLSIKVANFEADAKARVLKEVEDLKKINDTSKS